VIVTVELCVMLDDWVESSTLVGVAAALSVWVCVSVDDGVRLEL